MIFNSALEKSSIICKEEKFVQKLYPITSYTVGHPFWHLSRTNRERMTNISIVAIGWLTLIVIQRLQFLNSKVLESQIFLPSCDLHNDALHKTDLTKIIDVTNFAPVISLTDSK